MAKVGRIGKIGKGKRDMSAKEDFAKEEDRLEILTNAKTIAVVGLSSHPDRPIYQVAEYLQSKGCARRAIGLYPSIPIARRF